MQLIVFYVLALLFPVFGNAAFVNAPSSSAGVVERPIEKEYEAEKIPAEKEIPILEVDEPSDQLDLHDGETIEVSNVVFSGNTVFSSECLQKLIQDKLPHEFSVKDVRALCAIIKAYYVQEGYFLTRVYLPPQEVKRGILLIEILEGRLGEVSIEGNEYYSTKFIDSYFSRLKHQPINHGSMMKALFLLNENSDMSAGAILKRGKEQGTADMIVRVKDKWPTHMFVNTNNYGSHLNSKQRTGGRFDYGNLFVDGDKLSFAAVTGSPIRKLRFFDGVYGALLSPSWGTRIELSYLYSDFHVSAFDPLHLKGRSQIGALKFLQPHLRTRALNLDYMFSFDVKQIQNFALNQTSSFDKLREVTFAIRLDVVDSAKGRNFFDFAFVQGIPNILGGSSSVSSSSSRWGAGGLFSIFRFDYKRLQNLPLDCFILFNFNSQVTPYKLPLAEQFYIGGIDTVRGFPLAAGLGDIGYFLNFELRVPPLGFSDAKVPYFKKTWKEFLQIVGFLDHGQTFLNSHPHNET